MLCKPPCCGRKLARLAMLLRQVFVRVVGAAQQRCSVLIQYHASCRHQGRDSFVGETLLKAAEAAKTTYGQPPTILLVMLPDTGGRPA